MSLASKSARYAWVTRKTAIVEVAILLVADWNNEKIDFDMAVDKVFHAHCRMTIGDVKPNSKERKVKRLISDADDYAVENLYEIRNAVGITS